MGNYKPWGHTTLNFPAFTYPLKGDETPVVLYQEVVTNTVGISYHNMQGTNYTVTSGKTLTIVGYLWQAGASNRILTIYQSDDADASTNPLDKITCRFINPQVTNQWVGCPDLPTVESEKYVNIRAESATTPPWIHLIYGVEK